MEHSLQDTTERTVKDYGRRKKRKRAARLTKRKRERTKRKMMMGLIRSDLEDGFQFLIFADSIVCVFINMWWRLGG